MDSFTETCSYRSYLRLWPRLPPHNAHIVSKILLRNVELCMVCYVPRYFEEIHLERGRDYAIWILRNRKENCRYEKSTKMTGTSSLGEIRMAAVSFQRKIFRGKRSFFENWLVLFLSEHATPVAVISLGAVVRSLIFDFFRTSIKRA